jgi:hypothetical protein
MGEQVATRRGVHTLLPSRASFPPVFAYVSCSKVPLFVVPNEPRARCDSNSLRNQLARSDSVWEKTTIDRGHDRALSKPAHGGTLQYPAHQCKGKQGCGVP